MDGKPYTPQTVETEAGMSDFSTGGRQMEA